MSAKLRYLKRGFTLVELMIVVAIVGILAALAVYGVSKYVKNAKSAEARDALGRMGKDAVSAYERETMSGSVLALGDSARAIHALCASTDKVPEDVPQSEKYQSTPNDWLTDGWPCLKFSMNEPQYFQYEYTSTGGDAAGTDFSCIATGDLDGDGSDYSVFKMNGRLQEDSASGNKVVTLAPSVEGEVTE